MKLADLATDSDWIVWIVFAIVMQNNGNWNVYYSNSCINYGLV